MLFQKCDTPWATSGGPKPRIILRKNIFYYMIELPYVNGKRRFFRKSLHTDNFFEARQIVKMWVAQGFNMRKPNFPIFEYPSDYFAYDMKKQAKTIHKSGNLWTKIRELLETMRFKTYDTSTSDVKMCMITQLNPEKRFELAENTPRESVGLLLELEPYAKQELTKKDRQIEALEREIAILKTEKALAEREKQLMEQEHKLQLQKQEFELQQKNYQDILLVKSVSEGYLYHKGLIPEARPDTDLKIITIQEILNRFAFKYGEKKDNTQRKIKIFSEYTSKIGLKPKDNYSKIHNETALTDIFKIIQDRTDIKGDQKRKHARWIKEIINYATIIHPDYYKTNVLGYLPEIEGTKQSEKNPHAQYTEEQLKQIFSPEYKFFNKNPDVFWGCVLALFTGSRKNAIFTLHYKDIFQKDGIWCVQFISDEEGVKHLKNQASERTIPLHSALINMGFIEYINNQKIKTKATDTDHIFPICITSGEKLNTHIQRGFCNFLKKIGIKGKTKDQYDFHSFRKNANIRMEQCGITPRSYIDRLIGWLNKGSEGERSYSNYTIKQLSDMLELLNYDFLQPEFDYWKDVMSKK